MTGSTGGPGSTGALTLTLIGRPRVNGSGRPLRGRRRRRRQRRRSWPTWPLPRSRGPRLPRRAPRSSAPSRPSPSLQPKSSRELPPPCRALSLRRPSPCRANSSERSQLKLQPRPRLNSCRRVWTRPAASATRSPARPSPSPAPEPPCQAASEAAAGARYGRELETVRTQLQQAQGEVKRLAPSEAELEASRCEFANLQAPLPLPPPSPSLEPPGGGGESRAGVQAVAEQVFV
jgi:hypothetical protein